MSGEPYRAPSGELGKDKVAEWLRERARSYDRDADAFKDMPGGYIEGRAFGFAARVLRAEADAFTRHGPLPPLSPAMAALPLSSAAKCPDWPRGCGELCRRPGPVKDGKPTGAAVLLHRAGCAAHAADVEDDALSDGP